MTDRRLERQAALVRSLEAAGLDALLVTHLPNVRYLTGFSGSAAMLLVQPARTVLVTDFRYEVQAAQEVGNAAAVEIERANVWERLRRVLAHRDRRRLDSERLGRLLRLTRSRVTL